MNDLPGTNWMSRPSDAAKPQNTNYASAFAALRPTPPGSGRSTPLTGGTSKPATPAPANDSFSNLVSFGSSGSSKNLSLQEQQKRLQEQKARQSLKDPEKIWGGDEQFWNNLGSGRSTPAPPVPNAMSGSGKPRKGLLDDEDDLFVDLHSPAPALSTKNPSSKQPPLASVIQHQNGSHSFPEDDDDPFGLSEFQSKAVVNVDSPTMGGEEEDDDDVLGLLGKPASERPRSPPEVPPPALSQTGSHSQDRAIAELVDMGFPPEKARQALENTGSGTDVQAAVGWLLNRAHADAKEKSRQREPSGRESPPSNDAPARGRGGSSVRDEMSKRNDTAWELDEDQPRVRRRENGSSSQAEKDPAQMAAELGTNLLKTAGSLWKQGSKKVQQAYQEFNSDSDSSQPKWMRDATGKQETRSQTCTDEAGVARRRRRSSETAQKPSSVTDEALMLEIDRPPPRKPTRPRDDTRFDSSADSSRDHSPAIPSRLRQSMPTTPAFLQQQQQRRPQPTPSKLALTRQAIEEQASQAYVSSARRRKPATSSVPPVSASEPDLLEGTFASKPQTSLPSRPATQIANRPAKPSMPVQVRPPAPTRTIPPVSAISLKASHSHRESGNEHFKRGDYASAHQSYTTSLSHLPPTHPITIVLLTNHALTALKTGEPKPAITSADKAITLIGASKGEAETVDLQNGDPPKKMREYYGKALMRKAEALEQMERWNDAAAVWREAVEGGHGGATSIQGRMRAEKAAKPKAAPVKKPAITMNKRPDAASKATAESYAAVSRLRAANAAADRVDDEKFALADSIDARIQAWKGGKADNLRALLGSLDSVLWPEAGWKKISMADLVLPNKVKLQYMKGIAKVHPDKIPTTATTEQRMIAGAVFSTLNEAWDKFKTENGL